MKKLIGALLVLMSLTIFGFRMSKKVTYKQNISGYLKRAADANTIDLAKQELGRVIQYLEENDMTSGYTSVFWQTPDEDIGFWYQNLKASYNELENSQQTSSLEKTNLLMKLRETLMDHGGEGKEKVTVPDGLSVYPHNKLWAFLTTIALLGLFGFVLFIPNDPNKVKTIESTLG